MSTIDTQAHAHALQRAEEKKAFRHTHEVAAEQHEKAAKHHREAIKHHDKEISGEKAVEIANANQAAYHASEAYKASADAAQNEREAQDRYAEYLKKQANQ